MGNIEVSNAGVIEHKGGSAASHVGAQDRSRMLKANRPPGAPVSGDKAVMGLHALGPCKEFVDLGALARSQLVEVDGKVDDGSKMSGACQRIAGGE